MKKILITLGLLAFSAVVIAQTGRGWDPIRKKTNFRDSTYFTKDAHFASSATFDEGVNGGDLYVQAYRDTVPYDDDHTLLLTDVNKVLVITKATVVTITVPPYVDVAIPNGGTILFLQAAAGEIKFEAGAGVTLDFELDSVYSNTINHLSFIRKRATNKWNAGGLTE